MRARLALHISGLDFELREVVLRNKPADMLAASPKGTVPVLVLPDGQIIDESLDIMHWALAKNDPQGWLKQGPLTDMLALITTNDGPFKHALDRYKYPNRYPQESSGDEALFAAKQRCEAADWLQSLESKLDRGWLFSHQASLADMATLPFVRQFAHTNATWFAAQPWPKIQAWLAQFEVSALFDSVMSKHTPYQTAA